MTRINTNVNSLVAQNSLAQSNQQLQKSLTRLSTGLQINSGADNPAGLIASEVLKSDIVSVQAGVSNSQAADQLISTADSALSQVSSLLNNIRGLVSQSANTGALSSDQIAANQLQVDSSLSAIDRIAATTAFGGQRLLDGSLDFINSASGTHDTAATGTFGDTTDAAATVTVAGANTASSTVTFTAKGVGAGFNGYQVAYTVTSGVSAGSETVAVDTSAKTINFAIATGTTASDIVSALNNNAGAAALFGATLGGDGTGLVGAVTGAAGTQTAGGANGNELTITAAKTGTAANGLEIDLVTGVAAGSETASYNAGTNKLTVHLNDNSTAAQVGAAINAETTGAFKATAIGSGSGKLTTQITAASNTDVTTGGSIGPENIQDLHINQANFGTANSINVGVNIDHQATQGSLTYSGGTLSSALVLEIGGDKGYQVFNFGSGTTVDQIKTALNTASDATGVTASVTGGNLSLQSQDYGSQGFVSARAISGTFGTVDSTAAASSRSTGTDVQARINGVEATGNGLNVSLQSSSLDLSFAVSSSLKDGDAVNFDITGGGATFQLGPDVTSSQQARLGIQGVDTSTLGGVDGKLYELRSGGDKSLANDPTGAASIVDEAINSVTSLRGRLGAFQSTTLDTNINTLNDTITNLTAAQSSITDADFAAESANVTRAQILVQSGTQVLSIANQQPQNVLSLLKNL